ncbi:hypothetical protein PTSG_05141 [Salpingoeca rosetta]|uniref:STAS domain-containing protein n=1 Tax=Salpingoeca rosetta (strain ATCC 50818 / BSB-021) TaxID=946362 RepID=F2UAM1_SALR5|nr:uncharacterized protein PTSG_05141 [Salpingoeca rosetta]EGD73437.1 hypothetical protein PTSG_05141 [Salpingoeca rosetta]|eukprot:XP_004993719.1 hypothetical protein PTSG_05141 [Salpingoeca rosetta]
MKFFRTLRDVMGESLTQLKQDARKNARTARHTIHTSVVGAPRSLYQYFVDSARFYRKNLGTLRQELASGFTISVLQIPESVAFSFVAGVDPVIGLRATVFMALVCGALGARPGMVSGAAGAMAVILAELSAAGGKWNDRPRDEIERLVFMTMILTGAIQFGIGLLGLSRLSKLIPFTAMIGFMNGLAIIILISQLDAFKECPGNDYSVCARAGTLKWRSLAEGNTWMVILETVMAAITVTVFPRWKTVHRYIPAALVALVLVTSFEHGINRTLIKLPTRTVAETADVEGKFITPGIPDLPDDTPWNDIITYAVIMALVGIIESVMTSDAVAELLQEPNGPFASTQDTLAQGMGNFVSGLFGSMGGDAMIGQSVVNVINGARYRLSTISSGAFLALVIVALPDAIGLVPVACLTGILFIIVVKTFHWNSFILLFQLNWADSLNIIMVTALAVTTNLAIAVGAGIVWRALVHSFATSSLLHVRTELLGPDGKPLSPEHAAIITATARHIQEVPEPASDASSRDLLVQQQEEQEQQAQGQEQAQKPAQEQQQQEEGAGVTEEDNDATAKEKSATTATTAAAVTATATKPATAEATTSASAASVAMPGPSDLTKVYHVHGPLFFGSVTAFRTAFTPGPDPPHVVIELREALVSDFSGVSAIRAVCKRYQQLGKKIVIRGLCAHSQSHVHRNPKLRPLTQASRGGGGGGGGSAERKEEEQEEGDGVALVGDDAQQGRQQQQRRRRRGEAAEGQEQEEDVVGRAVSAMRPIDEEESEEEEERDLEHLRLFQPQGDELNRPEVELTSEQATAVLRAAGIEVEDDEDDGDDYSGSDGGDGGADAAHLRRRRSRQSRQLSRTSLASQTSVI